MRDVELVIYKDGERKVVGEVCVDETTGMVEGEIKVLDHLTLDEVLEAGLVFGTSLGPFREYKEQ